MRILALIGVLASVGYASAQCGCVKTPQYTVVPSCPRYRPQPCPKPVEVCDCPIIKEPPRPCGRETLPIRIQTPVPVATAVVAPEELRYRIIETSPCQTVQSSPSVRYDTKIEVPVKAPATTTTTVVNLRPNVDRYVVPSCPRVVEVVKRIPRKPCEEPIYVNPIRKPWPSPCPIRYPPVYVDPIKDPWSCPCSIKEPPIYVNPPGYGYPIKDPPSYGHPIKDPPSYGHPIKDPPSYGHPIRGPPSYGYPIGDPPTYGHPIKEPPVYVKPIKEPPVWSRKHGHGGHAGDLIKSIRETVYVTKDPPVYANPIPRGPPSRPCSGPILGNPLLKKLIPRYENYDNPFLRSVSLVDRDNSTVKGHKNRCKREVPFLKHGYKFMINMLPDFMQEPIKSTVNDFALTHPDERLQRMYNQPRKLTLLEKLQMQRKRNVALLKNRLKNRVAKNNLMNKHHFEDTSTETDGLNSLPKKLDRSWTQYLSSRSTDLKEKPGLDFDQNFKEETLENAITPKQKLAQLKKALLMRKLDELNEEQSRTKRSTIYEKHWSKKFKKPSNVKKRLNLLDTSEIVFPFYQVKEHGHEGGKDTRWEEYFEGSPRLSSKHRNRRNDRFDFLEPYSFKKVAAENFNTKEHFLRSVIREELGKYKVHKEEDQQHRMELLTSENKVPHSPILHVITFPLKLLGRFSDITKQAFPVLGTLPHVLTGTKKYFKDFGKNFKKHFLHLTSDLIGDFENMDITNSILGPVRFRRSYDPKVAATENTGEIKDSRNNYEANYLAFDGPDRDPFESKVREKRYILKRVDEDEIEEYLMEKLSGIFGQLDGPTTTESYPDFRAKLATLDTDEEEERKLVLQHLKPKIILDNKGKPFLEINGYKRPLFRSTSLLKKTPLLRKTNNKARRLRTNNPFRHHRYDTSDEADSEKIESLIHHAKNHLENNLGSKFSEMPVKTIKEKVSQLLFETDVLVHMNFEKYDDIYDDLLALQHMKNSIVEDWKRLIMSKSIDDIGAKTLLLERFKELQYYKDVTLLNVVTSLHEDHENVFVAKKFIKMLVRLQKLQCLINQVVDNFHGHLHISSKSDVEKEIRYADFLSGLNFANAKSRNDMIANLMKDRDAALQKNIFLLDKLKKLLMYEATSNKVEKEAKLIWEMKNIEKMQSTTIEEMKHRLEVGYKIKNELKILFDLLRRYETCEGDQRKLLSKFRVESKEEEEESAEHVESKPKKVTPGKKIDLEELRLKWRERLRKRNSLLKKQLQRNRKKTGKKSKESDDD